MGNHSDTMSSRSVKEVALVIICGLIIFFLFSIPNLMMIVVVVILVTG
jgi:dolichol kinase